MSQQTQVETQQNQVRRGQNLTPAEWGNREFKLNAIIGKFPVIKHKEQNNITNQREKSISRMRLELAKSDFTTRFILRNLKLKEWFKASGLKG